MILDVLSGILVLCLIIFTIAATFALLLIAIGIDKYDIEDIIDSLKNNKGE